MKYSEEQYQIKNKIAIAIKKKRSMQTYALNCMTNLFSLQNIRINFRLFVRFVISYFLD